MDDHQLLKTYLETGSQQAFAELVSRHVDLVYSAALRQCDGNVRQAQEVTQMVFTDLALKARKLAEHPLLLGWLHRACFLAAKKLRRGDMRRRAWETAAATDPSLESGGTGEAEQDWSLLRPVIDEALANLSEADRESILQRVLAERSFAELGRALGVSENSARMRYNRALERLQSLLAKRGIRSTASALALGLSANAVQAAPAGLAAGITREALGVALTTKTSITGGLWQAWATHKAILSATALSIALGSGLLLLNAKHGSLDAGVRAETDRQTKLMRDQERLAAQLTAEYELRLAREAVEPIDQRAREEAELLVRKGDLDRKYARLFRLLRLQPSQLQELEDILALHGKRIEPIYRQARVAGLSRPLPSEERRLTSVTATDTLREITKLLGPVQAALVKQYIECLPWMAPLQGQSLIMSNWAVPPSTPEEDARTFAEAVRLAQAMQEVAPGFEDERISSDRPLPYPEAFMVRAKEILKPTKYERLLEHNHSVEEQAQQMNLVRKAAYQGRLKLSSQSAKDYGQGENQREATP